MKTDRFLAALTLFAAAACGGNATTSEYADAVPEVSSAQLEITGNSAAEGLVREDGSSDAIQQDVTLSNPPEWLAKTRAGIKELNDYVKKVMAPISVLVLETAKADPAVGSVQVFGPKDQGNANWKLSVKKKADKKFTWKLEARTLGSTDDAAFKIVAVGEMDRAAEAAHHGKGVLGLDLDAYATVDTTSKGTGKLLAAFAHAGPGKVLVYRLKNFTPDSSAHAAVSAVIYGHKTASGETVVRVASVSDVVAGPALELMFSHLHWMPGVGGRADLLIPNKGVNGTAPNGDLPSTKFGVGKSCWNAQEQEGFKTVGLCTVGQGVAGCTFDTAGAVSACTASGKDASENESKDDTTEEDGAPAQVPSDPPTDMPAF